MTDTHRSGLDGPGKDKDETPPDDLREPAEPAPPRESNQVWWILGFAFLAFWIAYLAFFAPGERKPLEGSGVDAPAPYDWSASDLEGRPVPFSRYKGQTVFLNVWATWCGPCVGEMPSIARLAEDPRLKERNIAFVCVSVDDSSEAVKRFLKDKAWGMTILHAGGTLPPAFTTEAIPATFIIDPGGKIVAAEVGASEWDSPRVVAFLEKNSTPRAQVHAQPAAPPG